MKLTVSIFVIIVGEIFGTNITLQKKVLTYKSWTLATAAVGGVVRH